MSPKQFIVGGHSISAPPGPSAVHPTQLASDPATMARSARLAIRSKGERKLTMHGRRLHPLPGRQFTQKSEAQQEALRPVTQGTCRAALD